LQICFLTFLCFSDDEASSTPPHSSSSELPGPFHGMDEETRELIRTLVREKDEAHSNYSEESKKTRRLEAHLKAAREAHTATEDMALTSYPFL
jgi:hypothetical protein